MVLNRLRLHGSQESTAGSISFILQLEYCQAQARPNLAKLRPGQTLALAEPEARHYNHPATPPPRPPAANVCIAYISAISQRNELKFGMIVI